MVWRLIPQPPHRYILEELPLALCVSATSTKESFGRVGLIPTGTPYKIQFVSLPNFKNAGGECCNFSPDYRHYSGLPGRTLPLKPITLFING